jgi:hypothetical protein
LPFNTVLPQRGSEKKLGGGGTHISWFFWTSHNGCTFPVRLFLPLCLPRLNYEH